jgi:hypothetical protein
VALYNYNKSHRKNPIKYTTPTGIEVNLFTTHTVADYIGKQPQVLYRWETNKVIPKTFFVHKNQFGIVSRLYSEEQINILHEGILKYEIKTGRITDRVIKFRDFIHEKFGELAEKYGLPLVYIDDEKGGGKLNPDFLVEHGIPHLYPGKSYPKWREKQDDEEIGKYKRKPHKRRAGKQ